MFFEVAKPNHEVHNEFGLSRFWRDSSADDTDLADFSFSLLRNQRNLRIELGRFPLKTVEPEFAISVV